MARRGGFNVKTHDRDASNKEKAVDTELVAQGTLFMATTPAPTVLIVASGDRDFLPLVGVRTVSDGRSRWSLSQVPFRAPVKWLLLLTTCGPLTGPLILSPCDRLRTEMRLQTRVRPRRYPMSASTFSVSTHFRPIEAFMAAIRNGCFTSICDIASNASDNLSKATSWMVVLRGRGCESPTASGRITIAREHS